MLSNRQIPVLVLVLVAEVLTLACQGGPESVSQEHTDRAQASLAPFKEQLGDALMGALEEGQPAGAIHVCREQAPEIAARLSVEGVRMGRTSHKVRNPANAPEPWVEPLLAAYLEDPTNTEPRAVRLDDETYGYVEPISVMPFCLSCHGPSIEPELLEEIHSVYPEDQATGFKANELRGLFWVTLPLEQGAT
jgi:hypothetical protein